MPDNNKENQSPEQIASLTLELLKHIRATTDRTGHDVHDIKFRLSQVEETVLHHTRRFDRIEDRLLQIEKRLGLVEA